MARPSLQPTSIAIALRHTTQISQRCRLRTPSCGRRQFHATPRRAGIGDRMMVLDTSSKSTPPSPTVSKKIAMKQAGMDVLKHRDDIGLLPMTWVPHSGENRSKAYRMLYKKPSFWLKFYYTWLSYKAGTWWQLNSFRSEHFGRQWFPKNRVAAKATRPDKAKVVPALTELWTNMYTDFARANRPGLRRYCLEGIMTSLLERMGKRDDVSIYEWRAENVTAKLATWGLLHQGLGETAKGVPICMEQAVVRIQSTQILRRGTVSGKYTSEEADAWHDKGTAPAHTKWSDDVVEHKNKVEYFVAHRKISRFVPEQWKAWGFTDEITVDNYAETAGKLQDIERWSKDAEAKQMGKKKQKGGKKASADMIHPPVQAT